MTNQEVALCKGKKSKIKPKKFKTCAFLPSPHWQPDSIETSKAWNHGLASKNRYRDRSKVSINSISESPGNQTSDYLFIHQLRWMMDCGAVHLAKYTEPNNVSKMKKFSSHQPPTNFGNSHWTAIVNYAHLNFLLSSSKCRNQHFAYEETVNLPL